MQKEKIIQAIAAYLEEKTEFRVDFIDGKKTEKVYFRGAKCSDSFLQSIAAELFDHMANEHGLTLTDTELGDIIHVARGTSTKTGWEDAPDWAEIPVYWLKWANQEGLLTWEEGEAAALREEAHHMATDEAEHNNFIHVSDGRIDQVLKGEQFLESVELRAKVIRSKLAVWRKLVNK